MPHPIAPSGAFEAMPTVASLLGGGCTLGALHATLRGFGHRARTYVARLSGAHPLVDTFQPLTMRRSVLLVLLCAFGSASAFGPGKQWQAGEPMTVNVVYDVPVYGPGQELAALEEGARFYSRGTQAQTQSTRRADAFMQPTRAGGS